MVNLPGKRKKILDVVLGGFGGHITDSHCVDRPLRLIPHRQPNQPPTASRSNTDRKPKISYPRQITDNHNTTTPQHQIKSNNLNPSLAQPSRFPLGTKKGHQKGTKRGAKGTREEKKNVRTQKGIAPP